MGTSSPVIKNAVLAPSLDDTAFHGGTSDGQKRASDPGGSAFVAASAGSGKTKVLTDRLLRLLLDGWNPRRFLCLTFTKAAAGEMKTRLLDRLKEWAICSDQDLDGDLGLFLHRSPTAADRLRARGLFLDVLGMVDQLKIQTLHSFCQMILMRFPMESGLRPGSTLIDEGDSHRLMEEVFDILLKNAMDDGGDDRGCPLSSLRYLAARWGDGYLRDMIQESARYKDGWIRQGSRPDLLACLNGYFDLPIGEVGGDHDLCHMVLTHGAALKDAIDALNLGSGTDQERAQILSDLMAQTTWSPAHMNRFVGVFLTAAGTPRKTLATAKVRTAHPQIETLFERLSTIAKTAHERSKGRFVRDMTYHLSRVLGAFWQLYDGVKRDRGLLDYDDLLDKTLGVLSHVDYGPFVLYHLDGGIEHVLIDESQDTSPKGWALIRALCDDFYGGEGRHGDRPRTFFSVGDEKQSIYGFQGSDSRLFPIMAHAFARDAHGVGHPFQHITLDTSYRSTPEILRFVDTVFAPSQKQTVVCAHQSNRTNHRGSVILLPPTLGSEGSKPHDHRTAAERFCHHLAAEIRDLIQSAPLLPSQSRPLHAGDILILVRNRSSLVYTLTRALYRHRIPVMGEDRLALVHEMAILDLLALGSFLIQTEDDLMTACLLRSPLCGISDDDLECLATTRGEATLWRHLKGISHQKPEWAAAVQFLTTLLQKVDLVTPYDLFFDVLYPLGGVMRLKSRFGLHMDDILGAFLSEVYGYEQHHVPSMAGFLAWFETRPGIVKRDLSATPTPKIRIMTVHGSKGLQAPVVFLADTYHIPQTHTAFIHDGDQDLVLFCPERDRVPKAMQAPLNDHTSLGKADHQRLLYVALTRAEDHLYIGGFDESPGETDGGDTAPAQGTWYGMAASAMDALTAQGLTSPMETQWGRAAVHGTPPATFREQHPLTKRPLSFPSQNALASALPPPWLTAAVPTALFDTTVLSIDDTTQAVDGGPHPFVAWMRQDRVSPSTHHNAVHIIPPRLKGIIVHDLLDRWGKTADPDLKAHAHRLTFDPYNLPVDMALSLVQETWTLWAAPHLDDIFRPQRATVYTEVAVTGPGDKGSTHKTGRLDRLILFHDRAEAWIIDYKTDHHVPPTPHDVPGAYRTQMKAYAALLSAPLKKRHLRCFLLWTTEQYLMELT